MTYIVVTQLSSKDTDLICKFDQNDNNLPKPHYFTAGGLLTW